MKVPFVDLKAQYNTIKFKIDEAMAKVIDETAFIGGKYVLDFEESFALAYGVKHCISTANGTDSLYIIMKSLGIGPGDEVITVANSWISSSETITQCGAKPIFVDIDPDYYTIDERKIEERISAKTKAIIPVHLYGQMCEMNKIMEIAKKYNLVIIEDCAQSHFSVFEDKKAGTFGVAGSFSFYPGKNLGAYGDAGAIITNDDELAIRCKMFARHGALVKHQHIMEGINSRLDGLQAAILSVKLDHIYEWNQKRIEIANYYTSLLQELSDVITPSIRQGTKHTFHLYVIRVKLRNALQQYLSSKGIETAIHYPTPLPFMEAYRYLNHSSNSFPVCQQYKDEILSLPLYPELSKEQVQYIVHTIKTFYDLHISQKEKETFLLNS